MSSLSAPSLLFPCARYNSYNVEPGAQSGDSLDEFIVGSGSEDTVSDWMEGAEEVDQAEGEAVVNHVRPLRTSARRQAASARAKRKKVEAKASKRQQHAPRRGRVGHPEAACRAGGS